VREGPARASRHLTQADSSGLRRPARARPMRRTPAAMRDWLYENGADGIRIHGRLAPSTVFKSAPRSYFWLREWRFGAALEPESAMRSAEVGTKFGTKNAEDPRDLSAKRRLEAADGYPSGAHAESGLKQGLAEWPAEARAASAKRSALRTRRRRGPRGAGGDSQPARAGADVPGDHRGGGQCPDPRGVARATCRSRPRLVAHRKPLTH